MTRVFAGLLAVLAVSLAAPAQAQSAWDHVARVVVIGDLHGDYGKFHDQLIQAGLINGRDAWSGGATHLVQLGDVPDRAPDTRKILDLLIKLEPQARRAGGYVHALIGNHEAMNMEGDLRYTTPAEFAAFVDRDSAARRDAYYARVVDALKANPPAAGVPTFDEAFRAKFDAEHPLGWVEHRAAWSPNGVYGRWVLTHNAVIRIDDALYLHGGIGPEFASFDIDVLNKAVISALRHDPQDAAGPQDILWNEQGPLWYRGMAMNDEATEAAHVAAVLTRYKVRRIVLGHTKRYSMVNARFDGGVILTDIAVPGGCLDPHGFLIKEGDTLTAVHRGHRLTLGLSGAAHDAYLAEIAALDRAVALGAGLAPTCTVK
ncbi:metallophosphoesterase [Phenylobacterium sp.]|uniref:metallophosphoesterase n=1 Tax=Phenylobacterium sp. TaxID=1871053 RepID=UPI002F415C22